MPPPSFPITQINLHHSKGASAILQRGMTAMHTGLSLVQEPWLVKGTIRGLGGLQCFRDAASNRSRACIVTKGINVVPQWELCTGDLMVVTTEIPNTGKVAIASAYFPHDDLNVPPAEVTRLVEHCSTFKIPLLIGCDANAHHQLWGSTDTNFRGQCLVEYLVTTDLDILNVGNTPTFRNSVREEVLDLTLCTKDLTGKITNWRVSDEPSLSDHEQIRFDMVTHTTVEPQWKRNPRNTN